jgi:hypothetical protein
MIAQGRIVVRTQINGAFYGFNQDMLFRLRNGTYWLQDEYRYWYHYAYLPEVEIIVAGRCFLHVVGTDASVAVRQLSSMIESQISGAFYGWQGHSVYQLTNGQIWKQHGYKYEYKYSYRPQVAIYETSSGTTMDVEGCKAVVRRVS